MPLAGMLLQSRRRPVLLDVVALFVVTCMSFAAADNWDGLLDTARAYIIGRVVHSRRRTLRASMAPNTDGRSPHANSNSEDPDTVSTIDPLDDKTLHHLGVDINAVDERVENEDELDEVDTEADPQLEALLDSLRTMLAQNPDDARRQHLQRALDELTSASKEAPRPASRVEYVERLDCATPISPSMLGRGQLISGTSSAPGSPFAFAGRSPLLAGRSPLLRSRSSFVLAGSPLLSGRSPLLSGHSPLLPGRSPLLAGRSPLSSPRLGVVGLRSPLAPPSAFGLPPSLPELSPLSLPAQLQPSNEPTWQNAAGPSSLLLELGASKPTTPIKPEFFDAPRSANSDEPSHTRPPTPPLDDPAMFFRTLLMSPPRRPLTRTTTSTSPPQLNSLPASAGLENSMLFSTSSSIPRLQALDPSFEAMSSSMRATLPQQTALFGATDDTDAHVWWSDEDEDELPQSELAIEDPSISKNVEHPVPSPPFSINTSPSTVDVLPRSTFNNVPSAEQFHPDVDQSPNSLPAGQSGPWPQANLHVSTSSERYDHGVATGSIDPDMVFVAAAATVLGDSDPDSTGALSPMTFAPPSPSAVRLAESISLFPEVASWPTSSPRSDDDDASDSDSVVSSPPSPLELDTIEEENLDGLKKGRSLRTRESVLLAAAVALPGSPISTLPPTADEDTGAVPSVVDDALLGSARHIASTTSDTLLLLRNDEETSNGPLLAEVIETSRLGSSVTEQLRSSPSLSSTSTNGMILAEVAHSSPGSSGSDSPELVNSPPTVVSSDEEQLDGPHVTAPVLASLSDVFCGPVHGPHSLHGDMAKTYLLEQLETPAGPALSLQPSFELDIFSPSATKVDDNLSSNKTSEPGSAAFLSPLQLLPQIANDFSPRGAFERLRAHLPSPESRPHDATEEPTTPSALAPTVDSVVRSFASPSPLQLGDNDDSKMELSPRAQPQPVTPTSPTRTLSIIVPVSPHHPPSRPLAPTPRRSSRTVQSHNDVILEEDEEDTLESRRAHGSPRPSGIGSTTAPFSELSDSLSERQREATTPGGTWLADLGEDKFDLPDASKFGLSLDRDPTPQPFKPESIDAVTDYEMDDAVSSLQLEDDSDALIPRPADTQTPLSDAPPIVKLTSPDDMDIHATPVRSLAERRLSFAREDIAVPSSRVLIPAPPRHSISTSEKDSDEGDGGDESSDSDASDPDPLTLDQLLEEVFTGATPEVHPVINPRISHISSVEFRRGSANGSAASESLVQKQLGDRLSFDHKTGSASSEQESREMSLDSGYGYDWRRASEAEELEEQKETWPDSVRFPSTSARPGASIDSDRPSGSMNTGGNASLASSTSAKPRGRSRGRTKSGRFIARVLNGLKPKSSKRDSILSLKLENASTLSLAPSTSGWSPSESLAALDAAFPVTAPANDAPSTKESRRQSTRDRAVSLFSSLSSGGSGATTPDRDSTHAQSTSRIRSFFAPGRDRKPSGSASDLFANQPADTQSRDPLLHAHSDPVTVSSLERRTSASPLKDGFRRSRTTSVFSTLSSRSALSRGYTESAYKSGLPRRESVQSFGESNQGRHQKTRSGSSGASVSNQSIPGRGSSPQREGTVGWGDLVRPRPQLRTHSLVRSRSPSPARSSRGHDSSAPSRRGSMTPQGAQSPSRRASMGERLDEQYRRSASRERRMSISNVSAHGPSFVELRGSNSIRRRTLSAGAVDGNGKRRSISWSKSALELAREEGIATPAVPPLPDRRHTVTSVSDIPADTAAQLSMKSRTQRPRTVPESLGWPPSQTSSSTPAQEAPPAGSFPQPAASVDDSAKGKPKDRGRSRLLSLTSRFSRK